MITYCKTWSTYVFACDILFGPWIRMKSLLILLTYVFFSSHVDKLLTGNSGNVPPISISAQDRRG